MNLPISPRLLECAKFVAPGDRVADIGCDHGYLSIYLLQKGIASSVIASDINKGPLESAKRNAVKFGVTENISFYLSAGVEKLPRDFDSLICAGMGADTMISILDAAPWLKSSHYRLILQCQSKISLLRRYLSAQGWRITQESVLRDGRFLYTVMEARWEPDYPKLTPAQWYFPPAMLENPGKETAEYYHRVLKKLRLSVEGHGVNADPTEIAVLAELSALRENPDFNFLKEAAP